MSTAEWFAFWALIISAATLLTYLGQLTVLILVYRRVIKETDRNAQERQQAIDKAGDMMIAQSKDIEQRLNGIAKHNTIGSLSWAHWLRSCSSRIVQSFANTRGITQKSRESN